MGRTHQPSDVGSTDDIDRVLDLPDRSPAAPGTRNIQTTLLKVHRRLCLLLGQPVRLAQSASHLDVGMPRRWGWGFAVHTAELYTF
jgi:hypothetical protein